MASTLCLSSVGVFAQKTEEPKPSPFIQDTAKTVNERFVMAGGRKLEYKITTGMTKLLNEKGEQDAEIFSMAYVAKESGSTPRPLTFVFNGGPGSSSVWLHMGALGPNRAILGPDGEQPAPPYGYKPNPYTWLDFTDLVFIDPVGTGYSRAKDNETGSNRYWNATGDVASIAEFVRLFLTREKRWDSPLFIVGESYGTYRAAGLAERLWNDGIGVSGVVLVSAILRFEGNNWDMGVIPTYTATAYYHKKLAPDLQKRPLREVLSEVEKWCMSDYVIAQAKGQNLSPKERADIVAAYARYTGLSPKVVDQGNFRIDSGTFFKELLRDEKKTVGRYDARYIGTDRNNLGSYPEYDPSYAAVEAPFTTALHRYFLEDLGLQLERKYNILGGVQWGGRDAAPDNSVALRDVMTQNPHLHVLLCAGLYDLATPYFNAYDTFNQMALEPEIRKNVHFAEYESGHMMYLREVCLKQFYEDAKKFVMEAK